MCSLIKKHLLFSLTGNMDFDYSSSGTSWWQYWWSEISEI